MHYVFYPNNNFVQLFDLLINNLVLLHCTKYASTKQIGFKKAIKYNFYEVLWRKYILDISDFFLSPTFIHSWKFPYNNETLQIQNSTIIAGNPPDFWKKGQINFKGSRQSGKFPAQLEIFNLIRKLFR